MKEMNDDDLDRLFKQGAAGYQPDFEQSAWTLMERKLKRRRRIVLFRNSALALLLLLFMGTSAYFINKENIGGEKHLVKKQQKTGPVKLNQQAKLSDNKLNPANNQTYTKTTPKSRENRVEKSNEQTASVTSNKTYTVKRTIDAKAMRKQPPKAGFLNQGVLASADDMPADRFENFSVTSLNGRIPATSSGLPSILETVKNDPQKPVFASNKSSAKAIKKIKQPVIFGLTLSAGPDFNSVNTFSGSKPGVNAGLLLDVDFGRLTFSTGGFYTQKNYVADGGGYNFASVQRPNWITNIDGSCNVLDVPVKLSFLLNPKSKNSLSLSSGMSSYFMLSEKYVVNYGAQYYTNSYTLEAQNENQHYFGVLNFGAMYQFNLPGKPYKIGIEPYYKVPLQKIGAGNVALKSAGVTLNFSYGFSKSKR